MSSNSKSLALLLTLLFGLAATASAQSITANMSGQVLDEQQKAIPNAVVKARNVATNTTRTGTSDGEGRYRFPNLPTGTYELTVEANGFARLVRTGITLQVNQDAVLDATMKVSTVTEVVTITENASILNTTNSEVSTRFNEKRFSELPIATNRNISTSCFPRPASANWEVDKSALRMGSAFRRMAGAGAPN